MLRPDGGQIADWVLVAIGRKIQRLSVRCRAHGSMPVAQTRSVRPGLDQLGTGAEVEEYCTAMTVIDPFSNRIRFCERKA
jgi:hypothetical protein